MLYRLTLVSTSVSPDFPKRFVNFFKSWMSVITKQQATDLAQSAQQKVVKTRLAQEREKAQAESAVRKVEFGTTSLVKLAPNVAVIHPVKLSKTPVAISITPIVNDDLGGLVSYVQSAPDSCEVQLVVENLVSSERELRISYMAHY